MRSSGTPVTKKHLPPRGLTEDVAGPGLTPIAQLIWACSLTMPRYPVAGHLHRWVEAEASAMLRG